MHFQQYFKNRPLVIQHMKTKRFELDWTRARAQEGGKGEGKSFAYGFKPEDTAKPPQLRGLVGLRQPPKRIIFIWANILM